ncbi:MAG: thioredoxin, partial [Alphaproteobacteria bacterium]|nr:thioredoxin [Alphaproteobacteria bacterium]
PRHFRNQGITPMELPQDGLLLVLKEDCETCRMIAPLAAELEQRGLLKATHSQDNPAFPSGMAVIDDSGLETSFGLDIETVPTLIRCEGGAETGRVIGWHRGEWQNLTGVNDLGVDLPAERPGCGSLSVSPGMAEELQVSFGETGLNAREVDVDFPNDPIEQMFDRGWTDGLPVVPPSPTRVLRMLQGTSLAPDHVLGPIPPSGEICTVEKAAINAVMAGCRPEYFPVVLAALDAAMDPDFAWQGLMSTTMGAGVCVVVNGPVARRIGMNNQHGALGHGNRANATIARALQLLVINLGGALPGGTDRSTHGHPGKFGMAFAEDESDDAWQPLAQSRGIAPGKSAVTVFGFCGTSINNTETLRDADDLTLSLAMCLNSLYHPQHAGGGIAGMLVLSGEYWRIYREAGWDRDRIEQALLEHTQRAAAAVETGETSPG